jgi:hypothetical protein
MTTNVPQDVIDDIEQTIFNEDLKPRDRLQRIYVRLPELRAQRAGGEAVYQVQGVEGEWRTIEKDAYEQLRDCTVFETRILYTQPQPTLDFAAGMVKAAEICDEIVKAHPADWEGVGAINCRDSILDAIPADAEAALREVEAKAVKRILNLVYEQAHIFKDKTKWVAGYNQACADIAESINSVLGES